jgi:hypothetical protein
MSEVSNNESSEIPPSTPTLSLNDLTIMLQIIETVTKRGAWKPDELSSVGALYDRITTFINAANVAKNDESSDSTT